MGEMYTVKVVSPQGRSDPPSRSEQSLSRGSGFLLFERTSHEVRFATYVSFLVCTFLFLMVPDAVVIANIAAYTVSDSPSL